MEIYYGRRNLLTTRIDAGSVPGLRPCAPKLPLPGNDCSMKPELVGSLCPSASSNSAQSLPLAILSMTNLASAVAPCDLPHDYHPGRTSGAAIHEIRHGLPLTTGFDRLELQCR